MAFTVLILLYLLVHVHTCLLSIFVPGHMLILGASISAPVLKMLFGYWGSRWVNTSYTQWCNCSQEVMSGVVGPPGRATWPNPGRDQRGFLEKVALGFVLHDEEKRVSMLRGHREPKPKGKNQYNSVISSQDDCSTCLLACHVPPWLKIHWWFFSLLQINPRASLGAQLVKHLPVMWGTWVQSLGWEDPLEKGKATQSSILAWRIPWTMYSPWGCKEWDMTEWLWLSLLDKS